MRRTILIDSSWVTPVSTAAYPPESQPAHALTGLSARSRYASASMSGPSLIARDRHSSP